MTSDTHKMPESLDNDNQIESRIGVHVQDGVVKEVHQNIYVGGRYEFCKACGCEIERKDEIFECLWCGKAPIHVRCKDREYECCKSCGELYRTEERQRASSGCLMLKTVSPFGSRVFFLFAKRTLQLGRSRKSQLDVGAGWSRDSNYQPGTNDIIVRCIDRNSLEQLREESLLMSRIHAALRILPSHSREMLAVYDLGAKGKGSSAGTWVGRIKLIRWYGIM